jgi:hypothetical protein
MKALAILTPLIALALMLVLQALETRLFEARPSPKRPPVQHPQRRSPRRPVAGWRQVTGHSVTAGASMGAHPWPNPPATSEPRRGGQAADAAPCLAQTGDTTS